MPKRRQNNGTNDSGSRGGRGGSLDGSPHGFSPRGGGRGRPGRGFGRGGRGFGGRGGYIPSIETDFILQTWPQNNSGSGYNSPRGRGRGGGRGNFGSPMRTPNSGSGYNSPNSRGRGRGRGRGEVDEDQASRGRGRGRTAQRGGWKGKYRGIDAPLSSLLNQDRPLLKVINFVPAVHQRFLFMEEEEILKPIAEDIGEEEENHAPTADRVAQVFRIASGSNKPIESFAEDDGAGEEGLEEIDFADLASFQEAVEISAAAATTRSDKMDIAEEKFTGVYTKPKSRQDVSMGQPPIPVEDRPPEVAMEPPPDTSQTVNETTTTIHVNESSGSLVGKDDAKLAIPPTVEEVQTEVVTATQNNEHISITSTVSQSVDVISPETGTEPEPQDTGTVGGWHVTESTTFSSEILEVSSTIATMDLDDTKPTGELPSFFIDTTHPHLYATATSGEALGLPDDDVIVYVAPHPRSGRATPAPSSAQNRSTPIPMAPMTSVLTGLPIGKSLNPVSEIPEPPSIESVSFSFGNSAATSSASATNPVDSASTPQAIRKAKVKPPLFTFMQKKSSPARMKMRQRNTWLKNKRGKSSSFALRGAEVSEAQLWGGRDDSDVDWGVDSEDEGEEEEVEEEEQVRAEKDGTLRVISIAKSKKGKARDNGAEGMDVDPELEMDTAAMTSFVQGINRGFTTMDDLDDERRMREEDCAGLGGGIGSSAESEDDLNEDDEDAVIELEERIMIGEDDDDEEEDGLDWDDDDDDEDEDHDFSPKSSFQARLDKLRKQARERKTNDKGKVKATEQDFYEDLEDSEDELYVNRNPFRTWAEDDEDYIAGIEDILAENQDILIGRDRKARNSLFRAIRDGDFDLDGDFMPQARKRKDKNKDLPPELAELWEKDREKKAERRRERDLAKLLQAADPLVAKKGGKKGWKATARLANSDPTITTMPNRVIDTTTLVQQIRRFLENIGGPKEMALPPTSKETRKMIHELAQAFNLKSQSKGKGNARYTTLIKTTKSAYGVVNEQKIGKIVRWGRARGVEFAAKEDWNHDGKGGRMPKHREGDEVGKAAPKLNDSNIGFRLLAAMGWEEGARIGLSGGLKDPLTAVIKHSKLGLGASR